MPTTKTKATPVIDEDVLNMVLDLQKGEVPSTEPPVSVEPIPENTFVLKEHHIEYSKVFGKTQSGKQHNVRVFKDEDWPEEMRIHIPNVNKNYQFPEDSTEKAVIALMTGDKLLIHGPTGSGKSTLIQEICARLRIPFIRVNCSGDMESSAVFGQPTIKDGTLGYAHGPAGEMGLKGGVLCLDEISTAPPETAMAMQWMLEDEGKIYLRDMPGESHNKLINPHPEFRLVCTDNTALQGDISGNHAGTNVQNTAFLDRFGTVIAHNYLDVKHEQAMISKKLPTLPKTQVNDMLKLAKFIRTAHNEGNLGLTMSPRTLLNWGAKILYWEDPMVALGIAFFDKLIEDDQRVVDEFIIKVYGKSINK